MKIHKIDELVLDLDSKLEDLPLWDTNVETNYLVSKLTQVFESESLIPGIILTQNQNYVGMISRQQFFEFMSRPYSLGLFGERAIENLYNYLQPETFVLAGSSTIMEATQQALQRPSKLVYEPIVVEGNGKYQLLDIQQLLLAHSQIQILTLAQLKQTQEQYQLAEVDLNEMQRRYTDLVRQEKSIGLEQLIIDANREVNNPAKYIIGNLVHAHRYIQQLLHVIKTYQNCYPNPDKDLKTIVDKIQIDVINAELPKLLDTTKGYAKKIQQFVHSLEEGVGNRE